MLKYKLLQPDILDALAAAGHNSKVLIADGNFPFSTALGPRAELVCMNLMPGVITATQALEAVASAIPIQAAWVMTPASEGPYALDYDPPVWENFRGILKAEGCDFEIDQLSIADFYADAAGDDVALTIATAEQRWYSNILLSIGAVKAE
ncbi:MAG TPA: RbsD/FucU domain-containing protein [bacterium]|nr:RbsD/FucU domain-containing protein [bacterium]